ncbi:hypothetical protein F2Q69_00049720 [Brassica cretica]|uniref:Uncharacterized protein n=1 Tax=Brassica cretica TaxID=69181 RepID=A0A8S9PY20_BRACR|nr:hypothetical protein F2Q69_00049720 [Brassica cretica]
MQKAWGINSSASALNPPSFSAGEPRPPLPDPPDPPDPSSPLSPVQFPPLSSASKTVIKASSLLKRVLKSPVNPTTSPA